VIDNVLGNELQPLLCADNCFKLRPLRFELFPALDLFALCRFLEIRIDLRPLALVKCELGKAAFIIDRHRCTVLDGAR
jgi:hypothetical protein